MGSPWTSKVTVAAAVFALSSLPFEAALSADSRTTFAVDIDPQPLETALVELCKQGHLQLVISTGSLPGKTSVALHGSMRLGAALDSLLRDTGWTYKFVGDHTIAIVKPPQQASQILPSPASPDRSGSRATGTPSIQTGVDGSASGQAVSEADGSSKYRHLFSRLAGFLGICVSASVPGVVCAQQAVATNDTVSLAEVTITGSRVVTNGNDSPTPVTVVTSEDLRAIRPTTIFEGLLAMPEFAGSTSVTSTAARAGANPGNVSGLNLRGLGPNRTLVLYDGHRVPSTSQGGVVDANLIPQMLIQRVDVVTGGASAVYGSDALAGVVNFVTDRKFNGLKANLQGGISSRSDDRSHELGIAAGTDLFGGRGHLEGSFQTHYDAGIGLRTDRDSLKARWIMQGNGTAASPYFLAGNTTSTDVSFDGFILPQSPGNNPLANYHFSSNGVLTPFVYGPAPGFRSGSMYGGDGAYIDEASLKARSDFNQVYGRFDFDLTSSLHYFLTVTDVSEHVADAGFNYQLHFEQIDKKNAFLSPAYQQQMAGGPAFFFLGKIWHGDTVPATTGEFTTKNSYVNTGLEGALGGYKWEASVTHGRTHLDSVTNNMNLLKLSAALDAVFNPANGQVVCNVTLTNPGLYPGCVPMNLFGPTSETRSAVDYVLENNYTNSTTGMDNVSASFTGAPLNSWAGPVDMALSGELRRMTFEFDSDAVPPTASTPIICTGLRYNCPNRVFDSAIANRPQVSQSTMEAGLEANVPLLKTAPLAQAVDLNLAFRHASYRVTGNPIDGQADVTNKYAANTWKAGLVWDLSGAVTARITRSRDFRAPNLNDLYAPGTLTTFTSGSSNTPLDLLTGTQPGAQFQTGGNPNLKPEVAYTNTVGVVFKRADKFSLAVDYFDINLENSIANVAGNDPTIQRACYASGGTSSLCLLQERPLGFLNTTAANAVTKWYSVPLNIASVHTYGADVEANFQSNLRTHPYSLRALVTYQPHVIYAQPQVQTLDAAGVGNNGAANQGGAAVRVTSVLTFGFFDNLTANFSTRWRSSLHPFADPTLVVAPGSNQISAVAFSSLNLNYHLKSLYSGQADVFLNVQNLFDKAAPIAASASGGAPGQSGGFFGGDDIVGRYFILGLRYRR